MDAALTIVSTPFTVVINSLMTMVTPPDVVVAFPSECKVVTERSVMISAARETEVDVDAVEVGLELVESDVEQGA
jgi:hypothetical protein